jgi:uncharacterized protein (TIGR04552 family)
MPPSVKSFASVRVQSDMAMLHMLLTGQSVVDLKHMLFASRTAVDSFLRLNAFDTDSSLDMARLYALHQEAISYLHDTHRYRLPESVVHLNEIHDLFLLAANAQHKQHRFAIMILKVMHILHHISGRQLLFNTPISEAQLFERLNTKVFGVMDQMRASGVGIHEYTSGMKSRISLATKLLSKRSNLAAQIFDRVRFRLIVHSPADIVHSLLYLAKHLFPINYVIPEQSHNNLLLAETVAHTLQWSALDKRRFAKMLGQDLHPHTSKANEFSASTFKTVNFVADIPLRIDDVAPAETPAITFVQAEIQLVDLETSKANEQGEGAHVLYKERQLERVRQRLEQAHLAKNAKKKT